LVLIGRKRRQKLQLFAYEGSTKAQKELGIELKYVEAADSNAFEIFIAHSQKGYRLIIGIGFAQVDAVKKIAAQFPDKNLRLLTRN